MRDYVIAGGKALLPSGLVDASIRVEDGIIAGIGTPATAGAVTIDARGLILAPALVDIHGDAFERQMMPRPGVHFPMDTAIIDTDRQLAAQGIATAYHALTLSWEPGLRGIGHARSFMQSLERLRPRLSVEHRIQLRWETFAHEALGLIETALACPLTPSVAFNDHTSMAMRSFDVPLQDRAFEQSPEFAIAALDDPRMRARVAEPARRSGLDAESYLALLSRMWERRSKVDAAIRRVADMGRAAGAPMLSHDDTRVEAGSYYAALGADIREFPMTLEVAEAAGNSGHAIVFGAPNVLRGGSHIGSPSAADMVEAGLCDILASDYAYPAMLGAVARLQGERRASLTRLWSLVSRAPARAMCLDDRGDLQEGSRADIVLLDWPEGTTPLVRLTMSRGRIAMLAGDLISGG